MLSGRFRPFFLVSARLSVGVWVLSWMGWVPLSSALPPVAWHVHGVLFGYLSAILAGFLLTAIPNWTGRLPVAGIPLAAPLALWLAGRLGVALVGETGGEFGLAIALAFPLALIFVAVRELLAGGAGATCRSSALLRSSRPGRPWF